MFAIVDCNNFYASCERVFNPKLFGLPVVVLSNNDGCVIARSEEAKSLGIKMGEPAFLLQALFKKHGVKVFSSNYVLYGDMSNRIITILKSEVEEVEIYSIDECFLNLKGMNCCNLLEFGNYLRDKIKLCTGISVSIGIGATKTLAKIANKIAKKNTGVLVFNYPKQINDALFKFPIGDIWGIGRQYEKFLQFHGISTALQLKHANPNWINKNLSIVGLRTVKELNGFSCIPLELAQPKKKGICCSRSFGEMVSEYSIISEAVSNFASRCAYKLRKQNSAGSVLSVFLQTNTFRIDQEQYSKSIIIQLPVSSNDTSEIIHYACLGLKRIYKTGFLYKKAGVMMLDIVDIKQVQSNIFDKVNRSKNAKVMQAMDSLNRVYGKDAVKFAAQGFNKTWQLKNMSLSRCYTTRWNELLEVST